VPSHDASAFATGGADLELVNISKQYPGFTAVDNISLTVPAGSFFALLGPSGCGKTTTLRLISGLEEPTAGTILLGGKDVTNTKPHQRTVNTVFQSYALFPHMTILENVTFGLKQRKFANAVELAHEALRLVELDHLASRKPSQLSGGQQQRVALARAVVNRPALLLLDEPLGALDLKLRRQMQIELKAIQSEVGLTFLHVTHDQEEAMTMADTVAVMNKGRIEQMGPPAELYELPKTRFVATFLGQSNLFDGTVSSANSTTVSVKVGALTLDVPAPRSAVKEGEITVGVRPEKIAISRKKPVASSSRSMIGPGVVVDTSFTGVSTQYLVDVPGLSQLTVFEQNDGDIVKAGTEVWLSWETEFSFGIPFEEAAFVDSDTNTTTLAAQAK
jgi:spermidine/putrescine transport system ATP-binding protein